MKAFYLPNKTILKKSKTQFCRRKTAEDNNAKIYFFPEYTLYFFVLPGSSRTFIQILFPRKLLFRQVLKTSVC